MLVANRCHPPSLQDELLEDTSEGQALRDSWRNAVPNARPLAVSQVRLFVLEET